MSKIRARITLEHSIWLAAEAAAKAKGVTVSDYVETALRISIDPCETIERAAVLVRGRFLDIAEISDQIQVIADALVDRWQDEDQNQGAD